MDGLQDDHIELLVKYLRFVRFKRAQHVKDVGAAFEEVIESRLTETTFTNDEVADMLTGLSIVVSGDIESELMHFSHVNVLMLRQVGPRLGFDGTLFTIFALVYMQLIKQAETWKLNFKLDVDSLEDRKELEQIAKFEQDRFAMGAASVQRLEPLNDGAGTALMSSEIDKLRAENDALRERCEAAEAKAMEAWKEKEDAKEQAGKLEAKLHRLEKEGADSLGSSDKDALSKCQKDLEQARADLDAKLNKTSQFVNMMKMLESKNAQIKELRAQLDAQ
eukprot:TRINITY_DN4570_c0_g1_i2.p1 TRINITY_DN4570_c0_g1~~TRINITY_DN4570_c0_g1_i2.p1  ORF type:complete len:277 (+),score=61.92 TRINITY_DN4570_c0_g1_i2:32-862(+)